MCSCQESYNSRNLPGPSNASKRLENLLNQPDNRVCADCGSPDPKWVSVSHCVFICIKCSGVHRSLGIHISKVLSVKLDEWTDEQVDSLIDGGGNAVVNMRYEAFLPEEFKKPKPDAQIEERSDFINNILASVTGWAKHLEIVGEERSEQKSVKKMMGMVEFVGLIKVNIIRGTNLAVRDVVTSDPYVILTLGHQTMKTRVVKSTLNPVWNERLMLSIPDPVPPLRLQVYDKDTFSTDDKMGEAEIDIQPLVAAAKAFENSSISEPMQLGKWLATEDNTLVKDSIISLVDGKVKQDITLKLQNVERGHLEMELECLPLPSDGQTWIWFIRFTS
ncbi:hypothetical protein HPP92_003198 [Vanilla planifolia]|uniref:Uncharacterized protein n=1 Tax=Vanilla planifolia TaxID=51239 RepID=A0A835VNE8_VANPL|nr:hypothetical protein HPP92_003198 [Vanilla planifolia]